MGVITKQVENERLSNYDDPKRYKYQDHVIETNIYKYFTSIHNYICY